MFFFLSYMFFLRQNWRRRWNRFCWEWGGPEKVAQIMYTHVNKCKNDEIKLKKIIHIRGYHIMFSYVNIFIHCVMFHICFLKIYHFFEVKTLKNFLLATWHQQYIIVIYGHPCGLVCQDFLLLASYNLAPNDHPLPIFPLILSSFW
jgi:hypothetical protein